MNDNHKIYTELSREEFLRFSGYKDIDEMKAALRRMREMDVRDADPNELTDLSAIKIDESLPVKDRVASLLRQTKNPYCFKYNGMVVKMSYAGKQSLEECVVSNISCK